MRGVKLRAVPFVLLVMSCGGQVGDPASSSGAGASGDGIARSSSALAKPNIILIVADDLDSASVELMPKMKALLAGQGVTFGNAFSTSPICCPSRASMLTGQYSHNHGIWSNGRAAVSCHETFRDGGGESQTIAAWLKAAGYRTGLVGKYLNRYPGLRADADERYVPKGWDEWASVFSADRTSDAYYEYFLNENGQITSFGTRESDYMTDVLFEKALAFVRKGGSEPFFLWLAPNAPHTPSVQAPRHRYAYADKSAPKGPSFNEEDISDKPQWYQASFPRLTSSEIADADSLYRARAETMLAVDDGIEKLVLALGSLGQLDNTYIVFTSDNGFLLGQHRFPRGKAAPYEESIRIPLIVRGPGIPAGRVVTQDALNIDLAPTFAELGQAAAPASADGRSLAALFSGSPAAWRQDFLAEHELDDADGLPSWTALRAPAYKYVDYPAVSEQEYYDLAEDPLELSNRGRSLDGARREQLRTRLRQLQACRGATCRN